ncbi:MAG: hypothetical protein K2N35_03325 [Muribaculaceae bacterium]|nr:hypothetical protein [Muribaculaceae bacterium]
MSALRTDLIFLGAWESSHPHVLLVVGWEAYLPYLRLLFYVAEGGFAVKAGGYAKKFPINAYF